MENKIGKLNKKIDQYTKGYSQKDKIVAWLMQNQNKKLIEKMEK